MGQRMIHAHLKCCLALCAHLFALALSVVLCVLSGAQALPPFAGHGRWLILNWLLVTFLLFSEDLVKTFIPSIQPFSAAFPHV